jgi:antitoxin HicB
LKRSKANQPLEYYINMKYPVITYQADEGGFVAEIKELPGCLTQGETLDEAYDRIETARKAWIEVAYEDGVSIPLPQTEQEYSGRFLVRIPRSLHQRLAEEASNEGVSLNQYVMTILSGSVSKEESPVKTEEVVNKLERIIDKIEMAPYFIRTIDWGLDFILETSDTDIVSEEFRGVAA